MWDRFAISGKRLRAAGAALALVAVGLWVRFTPSLPEFLRDASGGAAYVLFWIFAALSVWPGGRRAAVVAAAVGATCCVEFSQLWHPPMLEAIRATLPGRLLLGTTFSWPDFPPYFAGGAIGWLAARLARCGT